MKPLILLAAIVLLDGGRTTTIEKTLCMIAIVAFIGYGGKVNRPTLK